MLDQMLASIEVVFRAQEIWKIDFVWVEPGFDLKVICPKQIFWLTLDQDFDEVDENVYHMVNLKFP